MDNMLGDNKNLKDTEGSSIKDTSSNPASLMLWQNHSESYAKTNKLITALYMVTDTIDKKEPIRLKLRTLGVEILSDIASLNLPQDVHSNGHINQKITAILSFLNIASDIKMASEMNCNILKKEFKELSKSIQDFTTQNDLWFEKFVSHKSEEELLEETFDKNNPSIGQIQSIFNRGKNLSSSKGHGLSIGVQKGSTLLKALDKIKGLKNLNKTNGSNKFEAIKEQRREVIIKVIKNKPDGMGIKDIIFAVRNLGEKIGEKTFQREIVSMEIGRASCRERV